MAYLDDIAKLGATAHYSLDETSGTVVTDVMHAHNLAWNGGVPIAYNVSGPIINLSGGVQTGTSGMRAKLASSTWFQQPVASIISWFKTTTSGSIMAMCEMRTPDYWALWKGSDDKLRALVWTGGTTVDISGVGATVADGAWHMAVLTWSNPSGTSGATAGKLYLDGALIGSQTPANNTAYVFTGEMTIGAENDNGRIWTGSLAHVSMIPSELSATTILNRYNKRNTGGLIL